MQIDLNIEQTLSDLLAESLDPVKLREKIGKQLDDAVNNAVKGAFSSWSPFAKALEKSIEGMLPHKIDLDDASTFDAYLKAAITERINAYNDERLKSVFSPLLDKLLERPPAEVKLTDLVRKAAELWYDDYRREGAERVNVIIEMSDTADGYWHLYLHPSELSSYESKYSSCLHMAVTGRGEVYSLKHGAGKNDFTKDRFVGKFYGMEAWLLALYTGGAKIIRDADSEDDDAVLDAAQYPSSRED